LDKGPLSRGKSLCHEPVTRAIGMELIWQICFIVGPKERQSIHEVKVFIGSLSHDFF
jgi:hypothetical protein